MSCCELSVFLEEEYKRTIGKVFTTSDGNKYILSKSNVNFVYLRCALFRGGCKGICKLNRERDLITPLNSHNHDREAYKTGLYSLKTKCKTVARNSQMNLRKIFDDVTRDDPQACEISFSECESTMFRARKTLEPKIPQTALEFSDMITTTNFGKYYKFSVSVGNEIGVVFISEPMKDFLSQITNIQYDGTFFTVPIQFYQLWTIFISVGRHTLPAIHCLLTGKNQRLYQAILETISENIPHFRPLASMSDWEDASRNAFRETYPQVKIYGCWFHFTQRIWAKTQKLGLVEGYRNKREIEKYIKQLMSIPFLPAALIIPTFNYLQVPENSERIKLEKLKKYFQRRWIERISPE